VYTVVNFIPDFLVSKNPSGSIACPVITGSEPDMLASYDYTDLQTMNSIMIDSLSSRKRNSTINTESKNKLIDIYYETGDYVFNDDKVTMGDNTVLSIDVQYSKLDNGDCTVINIICGVGSVNLAVNRNEAVRERVIEWLLDYMVNRLGVENVIKTELFEDYWL